MWLSRFPLLSPVCYCPPLWVSLWAAGLVTSWLQLSVTRAHELPLWNMRPRFNPPSIPRSAMPRSSSNAPWRQQRPDGNVVPLRAR